MARFGPRGQRLARTLQCASMMPRAKEKKKEPERTAIPSGPKQKSRPFRVGCFAFQIVESDFVGDAADGRILGRLVGLVQPQPGQLLTDGGQELVALGHGLAGLLPLHRRQVHVLTGLEVRGFGGDHLALPRLEIQGQPLLGVRHPCHVTHRGPPGVVDRRPVHARLDPLRLPLGVEESHGLLRGEALAVAVALVTRHRDDLVIVDLGLVHHLDGDPLLGGALPDSGRPIGQQEAASIVGPGLEQSQPAFPLLSRDSGRRLLSRRASLDLAALDRLAGRHERLALDVGGSGGLDFLDHHGRVRGAGLTDGVVSGSGEEAHDRRGHGGIPFRLQRGYLLR